MSENTCTFTGEREEAIVAYIYGEMTPSEHLAFAAHVEDCVRCQSELSGFTAVRKQLASWAPPEMHRTLAQPPLAAPSIRAARRWTVLHDLPVWAQAVAALLVIGVAAGAANLRITYGTDGLSVRTGWLVRESPAAAAQPAAAPAALPTPSEPLATRAELAALEEKLSQFATAKDVRASVIRETHSLVADSERRQQNELALRIGTMAQDFQIQRAADNARLNQWVGQFRTTADYQTRALGSLAIKVNNQR